MHTNQTSRKVWNAYAHFGSTLGKKCALDKINPSDKSRNNNANLKTRIGSAKHTIKMDLDNDDDDKKTQKKIGKKK